MPARPQEPAGLWPVCRSPLDVRSVCWQSPLRSMPRRPLKLRPPGPLLSRRRRGRGPELAGPWRTDCQNACSWYLHLGLEQVQPAPPARRPRKEGCLSPRLQLPGRESSSAFGVFSPASDCFLPIIQRSRIRQACAAETRLPVSLRSWQHVAAAVAQVLVLRGRT